MNYEITDPLDVDEVLFNGTLGGIKQSFMKTGLGRGTATWSDLRLEGSSSTIGTEANETVRYNATVLSRFKRDSTSTSWGYLANASGTYWNTTFATSSVGDSYSLVARYHPSWTNVKVYRNGTDVTGSVTISGGNVTVPSSMAGGNYTWVITCESPNTVSDVSFDQARYYRGQTFSVTVTNDMENLQTGLVEYYDPSGIKRGATIGTNFPLGTYTAVYWCENGTDAGYAIDTVLVTDNGSINIHLTDSLGRDMPGVLVNLTELNDTGWTDLLGRLTLTSIPFGNYTVSFDDLTRGTLGTSPVEVDGDGIPVNYQASTPYIFANQSVTLHLVDKFNDGFPATITVANTSSVITTTTVDGTASSSGLFSCLLDEGNYSISAEHPAGTPLALNATSFTVVKGTSNSFTFASPSLDARPVAHTTVLGTHLEDITGRPLHGMTARVTNGEQEQAATTNFDGNATFFVYWGNVTSFNITWYDGPVGSTLIGTTIVEINSSTTHHVEHALSWQHVYSEVYTTFSVVDHFGLGFLANLTITDVNQTTILYTSLTSSSGQESVDFDEGTYTALVYRDTSLVASENFTVIDSTSYSFVINASIDAYPETHTSAFEIEVSDVLGRSIGGLNVTLQSNYTGYSTITGDTGKGTFPAVYWAFDQQFNASIVDGNTSLDAFQVTINASGHVHRALSFQYNFTSVPVRLTIVDSGGRGYAARVIVRNSTGIIIIDVECPASGLLDIQLDEDTYQVEVFHGGNAVVMENITVLKEISTSFTIETSINAYPENPVNPGLVALVVIAVAIAIMLAIFGIISRSKSKKKDAILKQREDEISKLKSEVTEDDIRVSKEKHFCLVHKGPIEGFAFICPGCGTFYCEKCHDALKGIENKCWSCGRSLDPTAPVKEREDEGDPTVDHQLNNKAKKIGLKDGKSI